MYHMTIWQFLSIGDIFPSLKILNSECKIFNQFEIWIFKQVKIWPFTKATPKSISTFQDFVAADEGWRQRCGQIDSNFKAMLVNCNAASNFEMDINEHPKLVLGTRQNKEYI